MSELMKAPTVGEIARRLREPVHRVEYVIRSRQLQPRSRAGHMRIFDESDVVVIANELRAIDSRRRMQHEEGDYQ